MNMRTLIFVAIILPLLYACGSESAEDPAPIPKIGPGLNAPDSGQKVHTLKRSRYSDTGTDYEDDSVVVEYDDLGRPLRHSVYVKGALDTLYEYQYENANQFTVLKKSSGGTVWRTVQYRIGPNGYVESALSSSNENNVSRNDTIQYSYDAEGYLIESRQKSGFIVSNESNREEITRKFTYENGDLKRMKEYKKGYQGVFTSIDSAEFTYSYSATENRLPNLHNGHYLFGKPNAHALASYTNKDRAVGTRRYIYTPSGSQAPLDKYEIEWTREPVSDHHYIDVFTIELTYYP